MSQGGIHLKFGLLPDQFMSDMARASYEAVLKHGFKGAFIDVELDILEAIHRIIKRDMMMSPSCGDKECCKKAHFEIISNGKEEQLKFAEKPLYG